MTPLERLRLNSDLMRLVRERAGIPTGAGGALARVRNASQITATLQKLGLQAPSVSIYNSDSGNVPGQPKESAMAYYLIRNMLGTTVVVGSGFADEAAAIEKAKDLKAKGAQVEVHEFASDAEARMYCDPAATNFRLEHDTKRAQALAAKRAFKEVFPVYVKYAQAAAVVREAEDKGEKPTGAQKSAKTRTWNELESALKSASDYGRAPERAPKLADLEAVYEAQIAAAKAEREALAGQPTLSLDELTAAATAALEKVAPREKYGTRVATASTMLPDGSTITCTAADEQRRVNRYAVGREIVRTFQYKQDGKVISKDSLLRLIGGKERQDINEPLRAAFEAQAPALEQDFYDHVVRVFEYQKERQGGKVSPWPEGETEEQTQAMREVTAETLAPHCDRVGKGQDTVLVLNTATLRANARKYGEAAAVQWFYKTNSKLGRLEHAELHVDRSGYVVVTGKREGRDVRMVQQRVLKSTARGVLFHQFPAHLYIDGRFMPEAIYAKAFGGK